MLSFIFWVFFLLGFVVLYIDHRHGASGWLVNKAGTGQEYRDDWFRRLPWLPGEWGEILGTSMIVIFFLLAAFGGGGNNA